MFNWVLRVLCVFLPSYDHLKGDASERACLCVCVFLPDDVGLACVCLCVLADLCFMSVYMDI